MHFRRFSILALLIGLLALSNMALAEKKTQVFLLAGQSNMDGRGNGSALSEQDQERLEKVGERIQFYYNGADARPLGVTIPAKHTAKKFNLTKVFGPELFFGIELAEAYPDTKFIFIKRSLGGTSLYGCWNPNWTVEKATLMGEEARPKLFTEFTNDYRKVLKGMPEESYELKGMLWVQGESDSGVKKRGPKPADSYGANLKALIKQVRQDTGVPELPFMMLQVGSGKVVEGMKATANDLPKVAFIPQSKDRKAPNFLPTYGPPIGHYTEVGMKKIGEMFAKTYLSEFAGAEEK